MQDCSYARYDLFRIVQKLSKLPFMINEFRTAYNALKGAADSYNTANSGKPPITAYATRWMAEKPNACLPAFIIDLNGPEDGELLENARELPAGNFFYFEAAVKHEDDPMDTITNMQALVEMAEEAFATIPAAVVFMQKETSDVSFGKQTSFSFMCTLYIGFFNA